MTFLERVQQAKAVLLSVSVDGWLLYDFRGSNPILWEMLGATLHSTRRLFIYISASGAPKAIAHHVDAGKFARLGLEVTPYRSHQELLAALRNLLQGAKRVAMEYSPQAALPTLSWADAGTVELVRSLGVEVVSSAELAQAALGGATPEALEKHRSAARKLSEIVIEAFQFIGQEAQAGIGEIEVCQFIRRRFEQEGLWTDDGPIVAVNEHSGDPHYAPTHLSSRPITEGDWVLIDLWAKEQEGIFADITWVGYLGRHAPARNQEVFNVVADARDSAVQFLARCHAEGRVPEGWEVDHVAREKIKAAGYEDFFTHRLGHSLGHVVHGYGPNLDSFETRDTRALVQGLAFTIEPGIYLPKFGVRSEIDLYAGPNGPEITSAAQKEVVLIPWLS